jgi:ferredoxin
MTTYRIVIDRSLCSGFGACAELAPNVVALDERGEATVRTSETDDPAAVEAALACPMGAIALFETATGRQAA